MTCEIPLTQGRVALVDDKDYPALSEFRWYLSNAGKGYAARRLPKSQGGRIVYMHSVIMNASNVDHINRNSLDNQKHNLRVPGGSRQLFNRLLPPGLLPRGVSRNGSGFMARITDNYRSVYLGTFGTPEQAYAVYCQKAFELHGEYPPE